MNKPARPSAAVSPRLLKEIRTIRTSLLSDALGKGGAMDHDMHCFSANCRMAGPAVTVRCHTADILMVGITLSHCPKGSVLVIDGQGELNTALWGEITTLDARLKGLQGVVIDGAIRDLYKIRRDKLPVFARGVVPNAGGVQYPGEFQVPVQCGGAIVHPGDWVVGDEDGVVVIPQDRLKSVIEAAKRLAVVEKKIEDEVAKGRDLAALLRYHELLEQKTSEGVLPQMRFLEKGKR
jgi:RraA family protein